jgi:sulfur carrier protein
MRVVVNGETREVAAGATVADVVDEFGPARAGDRVAVAVDGEVVPPNPWR